MIERPSYLAQLDAWRGKNVIKVITGVRRCGKSTLMGMWKDSLVAHGVPAENIIHINLEQLEYEPLLEYHALHDFVMSRCTGDAMHYVLIDEVQNVPDFQKAVDSLYTRPNIDLYITGSNAMLLSGTLATLLSGRYVEIRMLPLSFREYRNGLESEGSNAGAALPLATHASSSTPAPSAAPAPSSAPVTPLEPASSLVSVSRSWSDYIHDGSFPAITRLGGDETLIQDYLDGILNTILIKDVSLRVNANPMLMRSLVTYLYDNIGNLISLRSIAQALTAQGVKATPPTVSTYVDALASAFVIYPAERFDVRGKKLLRQERKYYAVDMGLRRLLCSNNVRDTGRVLENVVYLELLRRYKTVYVGQTADGEIDFVTNGASGTAYWQVSESTHNPQTLERELSSFGSVRDNYPKTLLTLDDERPTDYDGVRKIYALDWLLDEKATE